MRRLKQIVIAIGLMIVLFPIASYTNVVYGEQLYPIACGTQYSVDYAKEDGTFEKVACYQDVTSAINKMHSLDDRAVVRHHASYSPLKIIAMNRGVAYSYSFRSGNSLFYVDQQNGTKTTYTTNYNMVYYQSTATYNGAGNGRVNIQVNGFDGVVDLIDLDLVPNSFVDHGKAFYLGGLDKTSQNEQPFLVQPKASYYTVKQNGAYKDLVYIAYSSYATNGNIPRIKANLTVGPATDWMKVGEKYYSADDVQFYRDLGLTEKAGEYYNYYQFVPLRSKSNIPVDRYNGFLSANGYSTNSVLWDHGQDFIDGQNKYGVNAMMVFAQAICESGWGTSAYAVQRYNLFGWNAVDSNPDQASYYSSVKQSIDEHMGIQLRNGYLNINATTYFGGHFGNKGSGITVKYASNPYYGLILSSIAYSFDKYAAGNNGSLIDYQSVPYGMITTFKAPQYRSVDGGVAYTSEYGATYQKNHMVQLLKEEGDYYQVQSTNYLQNGTTYKMPQSLVAYDANQQVTYIKKSDIQVLVPLPKQQEATNQPSQPAQPTPSSEPTQPAQSTQDALKGITIQAHAQDYGWLKPVGLGESAGTEGKAKRLEAIKLTLPDTLKKLGDVSIEVHVQDYGWLKSVGSGQLAGTENKAKRLEGIKISLTGELADQYDIYYRTHVQYVGWLDWAKNGEMSGTASYALRLEALQVQIVKKGDTSLNLSTTWTSYPQVSLTTKTHVQNIGWMAPVGLGSLAGTQNKGLRMEAVVLTLDDFLKQYGDLEIKTHVQDYGWINAVHQGEVAGTENKAKRLEAISIRLTGELAKRYTILYRVHIQDYGWLGYARDGENAGSQNKAKRLEAIEIVLLPKTYDTSNYPTARHFIQ